MIGAFKKMYICSLKIGYGFNKARFWKYSDSLSGSDIRAKNQFSFFFVLFTLPAKTNPAFL